MNHTAEDYAAELAFLTYDCALADVGQDEELPGRPAVVPRREARRAPAVEAARPSPFLSIAELTARWGCGRTFTYDAIAEMEAGGYLKRIWLGRVQRVGIESVERWEALHTKPEVNTDRGVIATLRTASPARPPGALPRPSTPRRRSASTVRPPNGSTSIVAAWRAMSKSAA